MRYLTFGEVVTLHRRVLAQSGGASGVRDLGLLESALAQPKATFAGTDLHPTVIDKAARWGSPWSVANHAFVDGNKRLGHAAMEVFLILNGLEMGREHRRAGTIDARHGCRSADSRPTDRLVAAAFATNPIVASAVNARLQPQRHMITPAAVGCKPMLGRYRMKSGNWREARKTVAISTTPPRSR